jgi:hypothetical protein
MIRFPGSYPVLNLSPPPAGGQWHRVNDEYRPIRITQEQDFNEPVSDAPTLNEPFLISHLAREASASAIHNPFDFFECATMLGRLTKVPVVPAKDLHALNPTEFWHEIKDKVG